MKIKYYMMLLLFILVEGSKADAQGLDASPAGIMISHGHPKCGWMVSYTYMNIQMKTNLSGASKVSDETIFNNYILSPQTMRMDMHMLMGMYGLTGRLSFMVMANYTTTSMELILPEGTTLIHNHGGSAINESSNTHSHATSGLGDVKLWALYKLLNGEGSSLVFSAGINFPSGKFDIDAGEHAIYPGEPHPYMMQLGTGSYDLMPGLTFLKKNGKLTWSAQALSIIRPFDNSIGYHYGNEVTLNLWGAYQFIPLVSVSLRAESFNGGSIQGRNPLLLDVVEPDANPNNYGGTRASIFAGTNFYVNKSIMRNSKIGIEFGVPVYQNLNGPQLSTHSTLNVGMTKSF